MGDTKLQKFVTDFYAASDVAPPGSGRDPYLKFFVEPATVVMATNVNKGVEGITAMRQAMWKTVTHRLHVPLNVASINATEKLVNGTVEYTLVGGKNVKVEWAAYIKLAFFKEDLVGQLSSSKSSPVVSKVADENVNVIDNDSDSDPEDYGRIETTISQTIIPNATFNGKTFSNSMNSDNHTQLNKIIRLESNLDYITPQRQTEPVARSPATNQLVRINEALVVDDADDESANNKSDLKDATSPLKNHMPKLAHKDRNEYDDDENGNEDEDLLEGEKLAC